LSGNISGKIIWSLFGSNIWLMQLFPLTGGCMFGMTQNAWAFNRGHQINQSDHLGLTPCGGPYHKLKFPDAVCARC
jgi:hypothetical protein